MIRYALRCAKSHEFEGWFRSSSDFSGQAESGHVACPHCGSIKIEKQLMMPGVSGIGGSSHSAGADEASSTTLVKADPRDITMRQMLRDMRKPVLAHSEDVGPRFAEEARRIHYEEADNRSIRGQTTQEEAKSLIEEGIKIAPLPILPEDLS